MVSNYYYNCEKLYYARTFKFNVENDWLIENDVLCFISKSPMNLMNVKVIFINVQKSTKSPFVVSQDA